jgi:hypothetical protein
LLPAVTGILLEALLRPVSREEVERQVTAWLDERRNHVAA